MMMYADDTQLYETFNHKHSPLGKQGLDQCLSEVPDWMKENHLKLNESKTEYLVIGSKHNVAKAQQVSTLQIGLETVEAVECAKNIGIIIDTSLTMEPHINYVVRSCYFHIRRIQQIRRNITEEAAATLACSLVLSRLDYSNAILYGLPDKLLDKLQLAQNNAARVVMRKRKSDHVTPLLKHLHWLPIRQRINYKIILLTFKSLNNLAPKYIEDLIEVYQPGRVLRSASKTLLLKEKRAKMKSFGDRAFSVVAPKLWNSLPDAMRSLDNLNSFKTALKTYIFKQAF